MLYLKYLSIGKFYPRVLYGYNIMDNVDRKKKNKAQRLITFKHVIKYNNIIFQSIVCKIVVNLKFFINETNILSYISVEISFRE